jgi:hypothetical protein
MEKVMQAEAKLGLPVSHVKPLSYKIFLAAGFLVWLAGTAAMRLWGHVLFLPANPLSMVDCFLFLLIGMPLLVYGILRSQHLPPHQYLEAIVWMAIPSMFLDVLTTYFFAPIFPNMPPSASGAFGAWLLWGYTVVLATGLAAYYRDRSQAV